MSAYADPPVSPNVIRWAAERVLDMHADPVGDEPRTGRCAQCQPNGSCGLWHWARAVLGAAESVDPHHGGAASA